MACAPATAGATILGGRNCVLSLALVLRSLCLSRSLVIRIQGNGLVTVLDKVLKDQALHSLVKMVLRRPRRPKLVLGSELSADVVEEGSDVVHLGEKVRLPNVLSKGEDHITTVAV